MQMSQILKFMILTAKNKHLIMQIWLYFWVVLDDDLEWIFTTFSNKMLRFSKDMEKI